MKKYRVIYKYFGEKTIHFITLNHTGLNNFTVNDYDIVVINVKCYTIKK